MTESEKSKLIISGEPMPDSFTHDGQEEAETDAEIEIRLFSVPAEYHNQRLDRALTVAVPEFSRSYLQQLIDVGAVHVNLMAVAKASSRVKAGDALQIELRPTPQSQAFKPEPMSIEVVFEDEYLLVVNKPAGLVVHPAPGNWTGTLLNGLLARDAKAMQLPRAGIVHRLDKDTSGLMVVARQRQVMEQMVSLIAAREVSREYIALAQGDWKGPRTFEVTQSIGRDPRNRLRMAVVDLAKTSGKAAKTTISLLDAGQGHCLVKCKLHTGRTHQIRVHMAFIGHPLVSDELYGGSIAMGLGRQALHARRLAFEHPVTGKFMDFRSLVPEDMQSAIVQSGLIYNHDS